MASEEDLDEMLVVDWRAGYSYAEKLVVLPLPEQQQQQQTTLPFRQKKATLSTSPAAHRKMTRIDDVAPMAVKEESSLTAAAGDGDDRTAMPVFYDLSDMEGTPIASRPPARGWAEGRAAGAKPESISLKQTANSGIVILDSDSDDEVMPGAGSNVPAKLRTLPANPKLAPDMKEVPATATASVADLVPLCSQYEGQNAGPATTLGVVAKQDGTKEGDAGSCNDCLQIASTLVCAADDPKASAPAARAMKACSAGTGPVHVTEENRIDSPLRPALHDLTCDDDDGNCGPDSLLSHDEPICSWNSASMSPPSRCDAERTGQQCPQKVGGDARVSDLNGGTKRSFWDRAGSEAHENRPEQKRRKSLPAQAEILDLSSDDEGCPSDPSWLRDTESVLGSGKLSSGPSSACDSRGPGSPEQDLSKNAASRAPLLKIPGLESPDISSRGDDLDCDEDVPTKKRGRARNGPVSGEDLAARQAAKQSERELKKAQREEEKRAREEKKEESRRQKEELKRQKEASKKDTAERKRLEKEDEKWRKGKNALKNTTVHLDQHVAEMKGLGSLILDRLGLKDYACKCRQNPLPKSIVWTMKRPSPDSQADTEGLGSQVDEVTNSQRSNSQLELESIEMKYVAFVFQGEEFAKFVAEKQHEGHLAKIRQQYPTHSVCYLICGLKRFLKKMDQRHYRTGDQSWTRPNVEEVLAQFISHHIGVSFRLFVDESELAEHVVGLTRGLAQCSFKKKLTPISVHANGEHVKQGDPNRHIVNKSTWLRSLVAIGGVNGAVAIAVERQYPTMRALLEAYLDPLKAVRDKESLLENLVRDGPGHKVGPILSKRIYRIFMAKDGNLDAKDAEEGADHFT